MSVFELVVRELVVFEIINVCCFCSLLVVIAFVVFIFLCVCVEMKPNRDMTPLCKYSNPHIVSYKVDTRTRAKISPDSTDYFCARIKFVELDNGPDSRSETNMTCTSK